jgi:hypothetical protein
MQLSQWLDFHFPRKAYTHHIAGIGGTDSWVGLTRLQADVIDHDPELVTVDFAVNDSTLDSAGSRADGFAPAAEALIRRLRVGLPGAKLYGFIFTWPNDYTHMDAGRRAARDKWLELIDRYGLTLLGFDTWLEALMGAGYDDTDVQVYFPDGNVHPNDGGYLQITALAKTEMESIHDEWTGSLPERFYAEAEDYEAEPILRNGVDNDGETGAGWSTVGTARQNGTAGDTITRAGTFCSFGYDCLGSPAGVMAWSLDGGAFTNITVTGAAPSVAEVTNFERGEHTVTFKIISGTVRINRFLAI